MPLIASGLYRFDDFELQPTRRVLLRDGEKVPVAPKTFEVLLCLVQNSERVVLKEEILKAVWPDCFIEESNLTQHIFWLRKALADRSGYIVTIPGRGYEFRAKVQTLSDHPEPIASQLLPPHPVAGFTLQYSTQVTHQVTHVTQEETSVFAPRPQPRRRLWPIAAGLLALLALAAGLAWRWVHRAIPGDHHEVVLADFENSTGDPAFDRALKTLLAIDLNQSPLLVVASDSDAQAALKLMKRPPDAGLPSQVAVEVCQRLNDQVVLSGLVANFGAKYLLTLTATDCQSGKNLAETKAVANSREEVLRAVDSVAADMRRKLGESLKSGSHAGQPLQMVHTYSLDALRAYSHATSLALVGKRPESIPLYQRAVELDPAFAAAWLDLAVMYRKLDEDNLSRAAIAKAFELKDQGDEFLKLRIVSSYNLIVTGDMQAYLRNLQMWIQMYPSQPQPWIDLANLQRSFGRNDLALDPARRAVALAPNNGNAYTALCGALKGLKRFEEAKEVGREAVRRKIDTSVLHSNLYDIALEQHDAAAAQQQIDLYKGTDLEGHFEMYPLFAAGKTRAAVALWLQIIDRYRKQGLNERADKTYLILLRREADYDMKDLLLTQVRSLDPGQANENLVIANAEVGRIAAAETGLRALDTAEGADLTARNYFFAQARAAVALARRNPEEAIADLEVSRPYDYTSQEGLLMRARAYLAARHPDLAKAEFRKIIARSPVATQSGALAHLGLARALEMEGNHAAARQQYQTLFALWKDADPDLPPLQQARAECARIP